MKSELDEPGDNVSSKFSPFFPRRRRINWPFVLQVTQEPDCPAINDKSDLLLVLSHLTLQIVKSIWLKILDF